MCHETDAPQPKTISDMVMRVTQPVDVVNVDTQSKGLASKVTCRCQAE
jgi:hypothetical protein